MDKQNEYEQNTLATIIGLILTQAKWLARALIVAGMLWLLSLIPILGVIAVSVLLKLTLWYCFANSVVIIWETMIAYYYVSHCVSRRLDIYIAKAKKKAGK
ncbi:hypothetical protein [Lactiplantibacillus plantarum]|uniref:hypothetical protein n=1 Tax=Lactiplantibacillus plantarum TaxID=1590 RepID=UPI000978513A|nr:hypothetical protein [Lactiplantibacillus plantarum]